jgi:NAD(P)-dependent dehydrogenase (short-subunit alcohol dehydrogenase family)
MQLLQEKLALITGAGAGIGAATARAFAANGAKVIVSDYSLESAEAVAAQIAGAGGIAWAEQLDVSDRSAAVALAAKVRQLYGPLDILVNNAGIAPVSKFTDPDQTDVWDRVIDVMLHGVFNVTHAFVDAIVERKGTIISTSSITAFAAGNSSAAYTVAKGGVRSFTQVLAKELGPSGVRVNAVAPGVTVTALGGFNEHNTAEKLSTPSTYTDRTPLRRYGKVEEIADPIVFLASDMASYVTGVTLPIDGGFLAV